jgi:hypothetical protein
LAPFSIFFRVILITLTSSAVVIVLVALSRVATASMQPHERLCWYGLFGVFLFGFGFLLAVCVKPRRWSPYFLKV